MVGNANSQHEQIFVKYMCRVSSQRLQTFQLSAGLEFRCRFLVFQCQLIFKLVLGNFRVNRDNKNFKQSFHFFLKKVCEVKITWSSFFLQLGPFLKIVPAFMLRVA